jgi:acetylornithine/N-succinyldiaminopimelate aminotransferase
METYARRDVAFERGEGSWLIATDGTRYLDFAAGVAVNALGHSHPALVAALTEQAGKLWHTSNLYRVSGQERLAERLCALSFASRVFFCNSGAEACEGAIKAARRYHYVDGRPERTRIITFAGAFHGRTLTTLAAAGNAKYLEGFGPEAPGFDHVPFGDVAAAEAAIGPETAAIMLEPIQGEGGVRAFSPDQLRQVRTLCDRHGLLLVLDEVQSGIGRTGKLFAYEWAGIEPDVMAIAKGLGGGFPVGAFLATDAVAKAMSPGTHGSTFGGNLLAMAVGNAVLDVVTAPEFLASVQQKDRYPSLVEEVRGQGLLQGLRVKGIAPADLAGAAAAEHMLVVGAGDNVVRILPPLTVSDEELSEATVRISRALDRLAAKNS